MSVTIRVTVVEQILELFHVNSDRTLRCIRFGSVFFVKVRMEHAMVYNNSPETISWAAVIQDDCVGEEQVSVLSRVMAEACEEKCVMAESRLSHTR